MAYDQSQVDNLIDAIDENFEALNLFVDGARTYCDASLVDADADHAAELGVVGVKEAIVEFAGGGTSSTYDAAKFNARQGTAGRDALAAIKAARDSVDPP